jgi:GNAT superfamily N-acetyltransferase
VRFTADYRPIHRLADGTQVRLRLLGPEDREKLVAAFDRLSPESRYRRFFSATPRLPEKLLRRLLDTDGWNHLAIGAETVTADPAQAEGVGVARFIRLPDEPDVAEAAVTVVDDMQRRGLGTLLVSALTEAARERGITRFRAEVLRTNEAVQALLHELDETARPVVNGPTATYDLALPEPSAGERITGPLYGLLRLAAGGLQVVLRRLGHPGRRPRGGRAGTG